MCVYRRGIFLSSYSFVVYEKMRLSSERAGIVEVNIVSVGLNGRVEDYPAGFSDINRGVWLNTQMIAV